ALPAVGPAADLHSRLAGVRVAGRCAEPETLHHGAIDRTSDRASDRSRWQGCHADSDAAGHCTRSRGIAGSHQGIWHQWRWIFWRKQRPPLRESHPAFELLPTGFDFRDSIRLNVHLGPYDWIATSWLGGMGVDD